jgi:hypothetical protein
LSLGRAEVVGDGAMLMQNEVSTAVSYRLSAIWIVLNDAQLGAWKMLTSRGLNVRIICEDNLDEDLSGYQALYVAFSPPELMPTSRREKLAALLPRLPSVVEIAQAPPTAPHR